MREGRAGARHAGKRARGQTPQAGMIQRRIGRDDDHARAVVVRSRNAKRRHTCDVRISGQTAHVELSAKVRNYQNTNGVVATPA